MMTARESLGAGLLAFSSIKRVTSAWSKRPPIDAYPNRLGVFVRDFNDRLGNYHHAAVRCRRFRVDPVLVQEARTIAVFTQQYVTVVMEIPDDRYRDVPVPQRTDDLEEQPARLRGYLP